MPGLSCSGLLAATDAKTLIGPLAIRCQAASESRFGAVGGAHPTAALPNPVKAALTAFGIFYILLQFSVPVPAPFPYIARHIVEPQLVGFLAADRFRLIMVLLYGGPVPKPGQGLISRVSPIPSYFIHIIASAISVTLAQLASACGIFPLRFSRQPVSVRARIDRYHPFHIIEIAKFRVRLIARIFHILVYVVIRFQALFYAPLVAVLYTVIPVDHFYRQIGAFDF